MANSRYEYVRKYEQSNDSILLPDTFIVVRIDGQAFHRFATDHCFVKPNDKRALDLMNKAASHVMRSFYPNIILAYGQSDEYSFVIRRMASMFNRRANKLISLITSTFTSAFVYYWPQYFDPTQNKSCLRFHHLTSYHDKSSEDHRSFSTTTSTWQQAIPLRYPPAFDGRCVVYPHVAPLTDYLRWRQVDCHINNLYNTAFYGLTGEYTRYVPETICGEREQQQQSATVVDDDQDDGTINSTIDVYVPITGDDNNPNQPKLTNHPCYSHRVATEMLSGTGKDAKNEFLFQLCATNYNNELQQFRKGTVIVLQNPNNDNDHDDRDTVATTTKTSPNDLLRLQRNIQQSQPNSLIVPKKSTQKIFAKFESDYASLSIEQQESYLRIMHCDVIRPNFWEKFSYLLEL